MENISSLTVSARNRCFFSHMPDGVMRVCFDCFVRNMKYWRVPPTSCNITFRMYIYDLYSVEYYFTIFCTTKNEHCASYCYFTKQLTGMEYIGVEWRSCLKNMDII